MKQRSEEIKRAFLAGLEAHQGELDIEWDMAIAPSMSMGPNGPIPGSPTLIWYLSVSSLVLGAPRVLFPLPMPYYGLPSEKLDDLAADVCRQLREGRSRSLAQAMEEVKAPQSVGDQIRGFSRK